MRRVIQLEKGSELRVQVGRGIGLVLLEGSAEVFGTRLAPHHRLEFPSGHIFAVYTWDGTTIEINGDAARLDVATETPMQSYLYVHSMLEDRRTRACDAGASNVLVAPTNAKSFACKGPRAIMVGPIDSGKSSLCKMLLGWAVYGGRKPVYVDLDVGQGSITIPGTIGATCVVSPVDPVSGITSSAPLVYFYGHNTPSADIGLYKDLVEELARTLDIWLAADLDAITTGMVINTMGWVEGLGYELLLHAVNSLKADVVLVLGQEKLCSRLEEDLKGQHRVDILNLETSSGVVVRNQQFRQSTRSSRTRAYFYGVTNGLLPHAASADFRDLHIFYIETSKGMVCEEQVDQRCAVPITIDQNLLHCVLAVSFAKNPEQILRRNIAGFIYVTDVDMRRKRLTYVAPCPGPLPNNFLVAGSLWWIDE